MRSLGGERVRAVAVGLVLVVATACSGDDDSDGEAGSGSGGPTTEAESPADAAAAEEVVDPYDGHTSEVYDGTTNWICHPDRDDDECRDLSATELAPDGSLSPADLEVAEDPSIDCFYVYPTTSTDGTPLADLNVDESELATVRAQAAPFASTCRVFAPAYRQVSITGISGGGGGEPVDREIPYNDVVDAWKTYISQHNDGRGVVLIGHSQGTSHLDALVTAEITGQPDLADRLVSAILLGGGAGEFEGIPACETIDQVGCVIAYASFPAASPPGEDALFGRAGSDGERPLCVDPADLAGGDGRADVIVPAGSSLLGGVDLGVQVDTRFVVLPGALDLSCTETAEHTYLAVGPAPGSDPAQTTALTVERLGPTWGLHLMDVNVAMGDLLEVVAAQAEAFTGAS